MSAIEVLEPQVELSLDDLAATANSECRMTEETLQRGLSEGLTHAILCGEALLAAQERVPVGEWVKWLEERFIAGKGTAQEYMRVATFRETLKSHGIKSLYSAVGFLTTKQLVRSPNRRSYPAAVRELVVGLCADGASIVDAAQLADVPVATARRWLDPAYAQRQRESSSRAARRRVLARRALRRQERQEAIERALVKEGEAFNEAYTLVTRLDGLLGQARKEAESGEKRIAINEAHALRDKMMDALVRALGVS
jgi:hypothetical protein